jgi:predicted permease
MGIRLNKGRMFDSTDMGSRIPTAIISETAARRFWPNDDPLGKRFSLGSQKGIWITIVGMAPAVRHAGLDQDASDDVYLPYANNPYRGPVTAVTLVLNSGVDPAALVRSLRQAVASLDRSVAVSDIRSMQSRLDESVAPRRFNLILIGIFAGIAIVLAVAGLYGLLAYLVTQRTQEIGVRMALGAQQRDVIRLVIGRGLLLASIGIALGVVVSLMAAGVLSSLLFGVAPRDPAVFVIVPAVLLAVAVAATYIPARVAANVDPLVSLRME